MDIIQICLDLYIFFFGLFAGMAACLWIEKIRRGRGASLRTACTGCGRKQTLPELIPIAGFILMGGRCKKCGAPVSLRTPFIEILSGVFYLLSFLTMGYHLYTFLLCLSASVLLVLSYTCGRGSKSDNKLLLLLCVLTFASAFCPGSPALLDKLVGLFAASVPALLLSKCTRGFRFRDCKLLAVCGVLLGTGGIVFALLVGCVFVCIYGLLYMLSQKKPVIYHGPVTPFLVNGILFSMLFANLMLGQHLHLFGV